MKPIDRTYVSKPIAGVIYTAEYERRNSRTLRWSAMPEIVTADLATSIDRPIDTRRVPLAARRDAVAFMLA